MGKQSKYDKLTYTAKREADKRMAGQYGVDLSNYGNTERPGASYSGKKDWDDLSADVARAAANDYDVRRSLEAASMAGNKKAQKIGSISNASDAYAAHRFMEKTHKNRMENGGAYDGANDQGNVTNYWNDKANNFLMDKIDGMTAKEQQVQAESGVAEPASTQLQDARDTVDELGNKDYDIFSANINNGDNQNQRDQASEAFLGKYKLDLKDKKGISPVLPS